MRCPHCASTDVGHTVKGRGFCLDCGKTWVPKGQRQMDQAERRMDWFDRINK